MSSLRLRWAAAAVLTLAAGAPASAFELATEPMRAADVARLPTPHAAGAARLGSYEVPAVLYGVWDPARGSVRRAFGLADVGARTRARPEESFRIASVTKTFTATAVLLLVDDGKVKLDAPAARYVGRLADRLPGGRRATVRELLGMTSGFPDYVGPGGPFQTAPWRPRRAWTEARIVRAAARFPPARRGSFSYSNTNYVILGALVARRSGMSFGGFVRRRILRPLGLRRTRIPATAVTPRVSLHGYLDARWERAAGRDVTRTSTSFAAAAAAGVSTLGDLARWAAADFGNELLKPGTRAARLRPVRGGGVLRGSSYGLGLQLAHGWHFHVGLVLGWETLVIANPTTAQVAVVVRNACCSSLFETYRTARDLLPAVAPVVNPAYPR